MLYAPKGGNVEKISKKIAKVVGSDYIEIQIIESITDSFLNKIKSYDKFIFILSTLGRSNWDSFYSKTGWDLLVPELRKLDLSDKKGAIIGLGNHLMYPDNFVDSMGLLKEILVETKIKLIGQISTDGYDFGNSKSVDGNFFVGLPIDEDNESELTDQRIQSWYSKIKNEFGL